MKLVTKYQISAINSCWEKCAYMFNVYRNQLSRQTGSRNLTGPKTLPTIWYTYMMLVTKYQISAINSCWEKCDEKYLGRTEVKQYTPSPFGEREYNNIYKKNLVNDFWLPLKSMESWVETKNIVFCSGYNVKTLKSAGSVALSKPVTNYGPQTGFPYYNLTMSGLSLSTTWDVMNSSVCLSPVNLHQYLVYLVFFYQI